MFSFSNNDTINEEGKSRHKIYPEKSERIVHPKLFALPGVLPGTGPICIRPASSNKTRCRAVNQTAVAEENEPSRGKTMRVTRCVGEEEKRSGSSGAAHLSGGRRKSARGINESGPAFWVEPWLLWPGNVQPRCDSTRTILNRTRTLFVNSASPGCRYFYVRASFCWV